MEELVDVKEDVREALEAGKANGVTKVALVNAPKDILHGKSLGDIVGCTRCGSFFFLEVPITRCKGSDHVELLH